MGKIINSAVARGFSALKEAANYALEAMESMMLKAHFIQKLVQLKLLNSYAAGRTENNSSREYFTFIEADVNACQQQMCAIPVSCLNLRSQTATAHIEIAYFEWIVENTFFKFLNSKIKVRKSQDGFDKVPKDDSTGCN